MDTGIQYKIDRSDGLKDRRYGSKGRSDRQIDGKIDR